VISTYLSWERVGAGEPLLLLHGIGSTRDDFDTLRPALEAEFDVLAVDLPGHGASPALTALPTIPALADAIEADLDALGVGRVHLLATPSAPGSPWSRRGVTARCPWSRSRRPV
jgi:pimeloyl-ACP methyl ester carboxylesterase